MEFGISFSIRSLFGTNVLPTIFVAARSCKNSTQQHMAYINLSEWKGVAHSVGGYFMNQKYPVKNKKKENKQADPQTTIHKSTKINGIFQFFFRIPLLVFSFKKKKLRKPKKTPLTSTPSGSPKKTKPFHPETRGNPATGLVAIHSSEQRRLGQGKLRRQWSRSPSPEGQPTGCWKLLEVPAGISGKTTLETFPKKKR